MSNSKHRPRRYMSNVVKAGQWFSLAIALVKLVRLLLEWRG